MEQQQHQQQPPGAMVSVRGMPSFHQDPSIHTSAVISTDPKGLLNQITAIVQENEELKCRLDEKDNRLTSLNGSLTQLLQKNQK